MDASLNSSSKKTYSTGWRSFLHYCDTCGISNVFADDEQNFLGFVTWCALPYTHPGAKNGRRMKTIKVYLAAIRNHFLLNQFPPPVALRSPLMERLIRGVKRMQGKSTKKRLPVTTALLHKAMLAADMTSRGDRLTVTLMSVAIHLLLRLGELCDSKASASSGDNVLRWKDVTWITDGRLAEINLRGSKTDQFRQGVKMHVFDTGHPTSPARLLWEWAQRNPHRQPDDPVFTLEGSSSPVASSAARSWIKNLLTAASNKFDLGLDVTSYNGHSLRKGGATTLMLAGVSPDVIKKLGRWRSWCYELYLETPIALKQQAMVAMATVPEVEGQRLVHNAPEYW